MVLNSRITWEKLCLELDLLVKEDPKSLIPLLIGIHSILNEDESADWCSRTINFMTYELCAQCTNKPEADRFNELNDFFFSKKDFQINSVNPAEAKADQLLFRDVLENRRGATLPLSILYSYLALQVDLPVAIVNLPQLYVVKWIRGSKATYVNLTENGKILSEEELLQLINRSLGTSHKQFDDICLEVLSAKRLMSIYLLEVLDCFKRGKQYDLEHAILSMLLRMEPNHLRYLSDRATVRKNLGQHKEAISDLKRYFSFTDQSASPENIQILYRELMAFQAPAQSHDLIH